MSDAERLVCVLAAHLLEYPDSSLMSEIPELRSEMEQHLAGPENAEAAKALYAFMAMLETDAPRENMERYVATFDHDPGASMYLAWHRYGNDRGQGKAMAALNALYRAAGFEPVQGTLPDYLPRMLEFMASAPDWAIEVLLDGFGPEMGRLTKHLEEMASPYAALLQTALKPLAVKYPERFKPRATPDPTIRPMARPEPETLD